MSSHSAPTSAKAEKKKSTLKALPSSRFAEACGFFGGPTVIIYVGASDAKKYILPKAHLCAESAFFRAAFSGHFREGQDQVLHLVEDEPWVFELVIQWLFTGTVVLSLTRLVTKLKDRKEERKRVKAANEAKVTGYLAFLTLCDKLLLRGDCGEDIVGKIKDCLVVCSDALQSEHLVAAARLPSGHAVRRLFAEATVKDFVLAKKRRKPFRFETELKELEGYAADLLFACGGIFRDCYTTEDTGGLHLASRDPFTNQYFLVKVNK